MAGSVPVLHPEAQTVDEMLEGWRNQQLCGDLDHGMIVGALPSGLEVNSAESDSAVRYRHGEFESSHGQASSFFCLSVVAPFDRGEQIQQRPAIVP